MLRALVVLAAIADTAAAEPHASFVSRVRLPRGPFITYFRDTVSCGLRRDHTIQCFDETGALLPAYAPKGTFKTLDYRLGIGCAIGKDDRVTCFGRSKFEAAPKPPATAVRAIHLDYLDLCWIDARGAIGCGEKVLGASTAKKPTGTYQQIACGTHACCALATDGAIRCFGEASELTAPPSGKFTALVAGGVLGCALAKSGEITCWGAKDELPSGLPHDAFAQLTFDDDRLCALRADGTGTCFMRWKDPEPIPGAVSWYEGECGVDRDGEVACSGKDFFGPIPDGAFSDLAGGNDAMCALDATGHATCWGESKLLAKLPRAPIAKLGFSSVSACAQLRDGTLTCWGFEVTAPTTRSLAKLAVGSAICGLDTKRAAVCSGNLTERPPGGPLRAIASGEATSCAITDDGHVACWLTYGYIDDHRESVHPPTDAGYVDIAVGYEHGCALRQDGTAKCWGRDVAGETTAPAGQFQQLVLAEKRTCGLHRDGTVACWGGDPAPAPAGVRFDKLAMTTDKDLQSPSYVCGIETGSHHLRCWAYERPR